MALRPAPFVGIALALASLPLHAQPDPGLYLRDDGVEVAVFDLADRMPDNRSVLTVVEFGSGRVRTLAEGTGARWTAGPAWFQDDPVEYALTPSGGGWSWEEGERTMPLRRIRLREEEVVYTSPDGTRIAGTLVLPPPEVATPPYPAVVMIHGAGPATRSTPLYIARPLAARGVAVLAADKRGTGDSEGDVDASIARLGGDAAGGYDLLASRPEIDAERIGYFAASQGGLILAYAAAARTPAFVACRVCAVLPGTRTTEAEITGRLRAAGVGADEIDAALETVRAQHRHALTGEGWESYRDGMEAGAGSRWQEVLNLVNVLPREAEGRWSWYRDYLSADPLAFFDAFEGPALAVFGGADERIPIDLHGPPLREALSDGHPSSEVRVLPDATHGLFETVEGGGPFRRYVPGWHLELFDWIVRAAAESG